MIIDEADPDMAYRTACRAYEGQKRYSGEEVVLVKLAERLHNMRTIEYIDACTTLTPQIQPLIESAV